jgi:hypothetical protein
MHYLFKKINYLWYDRLVGHCLSALYTYNDILDAGHYGLNIIDDIQATKCWLITTESCLYLNPYKDHKQILFIEMKHVILTVDSYEFLCVRSGTRSGSSPSLVSFFSQILGAAIATLLSVAASWSMREPWAGSTLSHHMIFSLRLHLCPGNWLVTE